MKHSILRSISVLACLCVSLLASGQNLTVKGRVSDEKGEPVIGAVIMLDGKSNVGAVSDINGAYVLDIPAGDVRNATVSVSCMGYQTLNEKISSRALIDFVLKLDSEQLEEVLVVGYGSMRKSDLTGSVASVKVDETDAAQSTSLDALIEGHASGVEVISNSGSPDSGVNIRIRGLGSINGSTEPLYVVDGILLNPPTEAGSTLFANAGLDTDNDNDEMNGLMGINPNDIESMEILKDASATAIYGALGANGVVLITTKSAKKEKPSVTASAGMDVSTLYRKMPIMSFDEYVDYRVATGRASLGTYYENPEERTGLKVNPIDWQDYTIKPAVTQRYNIAISGKPKTLSYRFSLGYNKKDGIIKETGSQQLNTRLNLDKRFGKKFSIGTKTNFAYITSESMQSSSNGSLTANTSIIRSILGSKPYTKKSDDDEDGDDEEDDLETSATPRRWLLYTESKREEIRVTPSVYAQYKPLDWLTIKATAGADYRDFLITKFKGSHVNSRQTGSVASMGASKAMRWNADLLFMFNHKFKGGHSLSGTLGSTAITSYNRNQVTEGWNIEQDGAMSDNINAAVNADFRYNETRISSLSFFARGIYNYKDRYVLTATYRADGSSKFLGSNKWAYFPSFAFAWRITQEPWFDFPFVSNAKLRLGWGRVGNQSSPAYRTLATYSPVDYPDHSASNPAGTVIGLSPGYIPNPELKWETTEQLNAGLDLGLWKGRFSLTADVYDKNTFDLLQSRNISYTSGYTTMWVNMGSIRNRGAELSLEVVPVKTTSFEWGINGNISMNRNTITSIGDDQGGNIFLTADEESFQHYFLGSKIGSGSTAGFPLNIFIEGQPMGLFYGLKTDGLVQEGETGPGWLEGETVGPGRVRYCDLNNDGIINENDRTVIGDPNPDFTYGFGTTFSYRRWALTAKFVGSQGKDLFNIYRVSLTNTQSASSTGNKLRVVATDTWSPEHPDATYPNDRNYDGSEAKWISDRFVEDASYLRMSNLRLSYDFRFGKKSPVKGFNVGASVNNLFIITSYTGWNPVSNSHGSSKLKMGADAGNYPAARTYCLDFKLTF